MSDHSIALVHALRLGTEGMSTLVRDLLDRGATIPRPERMTTDTGRAAVAGAHTASAPAPNWIPATQPPPVDEWVLVYSDAPDDVRYDIGSLNADGNWRCLGWDYPVTHWQPLPQAPGAAESIAQ
jgi:hypothetical protein